MERRSSPIHGLELAASIGLYSGLQPAALGHVGDLIKFFAVYVHNPFYMGYYSLINPRRMKG